MTDNRHPMPDARFQKSEVRSGSDPSPRSSGGTRRASAAGGRFSSSQYQEAPVHHVAPTVAGVPPAPREDGKETDVRSCKQRAKRAQNASSFMSISQPVSFCAAAVRRAILGSASLAKNRADAILPS